MQLYIKEIKYFEPFQLVKKLPEDKVYVFLDGASRTAKGHFSFIAYDPFSIISCQNGIMSIDGVPSSKSPITLLKQQLRDYHFYHGGNLPFVGGLAGYIGYEFIEVLESKIKLSKNKSEFPQLIMGLFDLVVVFDHSAQRAWIYSSGFPEKNEHYRLTRARERASQIFSLINNDDCSICTATSFLDKSEIKSNVSYKHYCSIINKIKEYIQAGEIYQANISQQYSCTLPSDFSILQMYQRLRQTNPAPFSALINFKAVAIASASPERFISVKENFVVTSPIKGTAKRSSNPIEDEMLARDLSASEKNRAENLMIVDLMRNDLSKVCDLFSVKVEKLFALESFASVHHLVSTITGELKKDHDLIDLLAATFPGGSITGAPKLRAITIIDELESSTRGPYCGSIGYLGFNGTMDTSIVIRTFVIKNKLLTFNVGGGIVADSVTSEEYLETLIKANALFATLTNSNFESQPSKLLK